MSSVSPLPPQANVEPSKTVLVTGGAGFIGSHLCERLVQEGHRVISLDAYFNGSRENHVSGVDYREGHTKDIGELVPEQVDLIYHLGEYSRVEKSFEDAAVVWDLNLTGTQAVVEYWRQRRCKLVYAGSSTKFADDGQGRDQSPYAWSKAINTELVRNYAAWYELPYAITYFYNVYGPRESAGAYGTVVAIFARQRMLGLPLTVVLPGTQRRIFTHIDDIVAGLRSVGTAGEGDGFAIGGTDEVSILELAALFGGDTLLLPERAGNRQTAQIDTSRTRALGWEPKGSLRAYVTDLLQRSAVNIPREKRVLVFTTSFHPVVGPAEKALLELAEKMPDLEFDVITAACTPKAHTAESPLPNVHIHRVGSGTRADKYLLPIAGRARALAVARQHPPLFAWSIVASYGTFAAIAVRDAIQVPLLITLADQRLTWLTRQALRFFIGKSDQVYATLPYQQERIASLRRLPIDRRSLGEGDALANQLRFSYSHTLRAILTKDKADTA